MSLTVTALYSIIPEVMCLPSNEHSAWHKWALEKCLQMMSDKNDGQKGGKRGVHGKTHQNVVLLFSR